MTPLVKALLAVALVVPLVAYVAGSLAASGGETPEQQGTVFISDADPASDTTPPSSGPTSKPEPSPTSRPTPSPSGPSPTRDNQPTQTPSGDTDDEEARVVTPAPVEDDDERDDDQDDRDDSDDGGDTDD